MGNRYLGKGILKDQDYTLAQLLAVQGAYIPLKGEPIITADKKVMIGDGVNTVTDLNKFPFCRTNLTANSDETYAAGDFESGNVLLLITSGAGADLTITIPDPSTLMASDIITIMKIDSGVARAQIVPAAGNINGAPSVYLVDQFNSIKLIPNGSDYLVLELNIFYRWDWTNFTDWRGSTGTLATVTHGMGFPLPYIDAKLFLSATGNDSDATLFNPVSFDLAGSVNLAYGLGVIAKDTDNLDIITGTNGIKFWKDAGSEQLLVGAQSWYISGLFRLVIV